MGVGQAKLEENDWRCMNCQYINTIDDWEKPNEAKCDSCNKMNQAVLVKI